MDDWELSGSFLLASPTGIKILSWIATMWGEEIALVSHIPQLMLSINRVEV